MSKITLPELNEINVENPCEAGKPYIYIYIGREGRFSDTAIVTGGYGKNNKGRYWLRNPEENATPCTCAKIMLENGEDSFSNVQVRHIGVRPVLKYSSIDDLKNVLSGELEDYKDGIKKGKVYVPLYAADKNTQDKLKELYNNGSLKPFNQDELMFTTYSKIDTDNNKEEYNSNKNYYYEHEGDLYLLLHVNSGYNYKLSNGEKCKRGDLVFIKVQEADLYINPENLKAYFSDVLFAGVPIDSTGNYPENWDNSDMQKYLNDYLQQLEKLQKSVNKIKGKTDNDLSKNKGNKGKNPDRSKEQEKLAEHFNYLCKKNERASYKEEQLRYKYLTRKQRKRDTERDGITY